MKNLSSHYGNTILIKKNPVKFFFLLLFTCSIALSSDRNTYNFYTILLSLAIFALHNNINNFIDEKQASWFNMFCIPPERANDSKNCGKSVLKKRRICKFEYQPFP